MATRRSLRHDGHALLSSARQVTHIQHHDDRPVVTTRPKENPAYFKIARHYGWALDQVRTVARVAMGRQSVAL